MARGIGSGRGLAWGDVRLVEFGSPDKTRPALVLTRSSAIPFLNALTVAPISRTIRDVPTEIRVGVDHGLKVESGVNLTRLQTVDKARIGRYLGSIGPARKAEIREALLLALELDE